MLLVINGIIFLLLPFCVLGQVQITGRIIDSRSHDPIVYAHVGIKNMGVGTISQENGLFSLDLSVENMTDTLSFSQVGYHGQGIPIKKLLVDEPLIIQLTRKTTELSEVEIKGQKLVEKKYGIKNRNTLIHFTDGVFTNDNFFEIGQLIKLGKRRAQITSINLYTYSTQSDSATFRINFYRFDKAGKRPGERILEHSIIQEHLVTEGWLKLDLRSHELLLSGDFIASLEFVSDLSKSHSWTYEIRLGGFAKSFYRRSSLEVWNSPPHHYCMFVTALVEKGTPDDPVYQEPDRTFSMVSKEVQEEFSVFVRLPDDYDETPGKKYPVVYQLDGNAYFLQVGQVVEALSRAKKIDVEPIVIGVGYDNAYVMDSLRVRDYTYPHVKHITLSGGGDRFFQFLSRELIPEIDRIYRTDTTNRTLMGHSFGGYFTLYAMSQDSSVFQNYVAASPSIAYADYYLEKSLKNNLKPTNTVNLYVTKGSLEMDLKRTEGLDNLAKIFQYNEINTKLKVYEKMDHLGTALPSFEDGLEFVFRK